MVTLVAHWEQWWPDVGLRCLRLWPIQCFSNYTHKVLYLWSCLSREELMRLSLANHMANAPLSSWISTPPSFRLAWFLHRIILSPASYFILSHYQRPNPISTPNYLITWRTPYLMLSHQLLTLHNDPGSFPHWTSPEMPWTYFDHWPRPRRKILKLTKFAFFFFYNGQFEENVLGCPWGPFIASKICCSPRNI